MDAKVIDKLYKFFVLRQKSNVDSEKNLLATDNLARLADLNAVQRPPFNLVESTLKQKISRVFDQVEFFSLYEDERNFVLNLTIFLS